MTDKQIEQLRELMGYYQIENSIAYSQPMPDNKAYAYFTRGSISALYEVFKILDIEMEV